MVTLSFRLLDKSPLSHHPRGWIKRTRRGVEGEAPGLTSEYEIIQIIGR